MHKPKVVLVVLDGWGYSPTHKGNAIWAAKTPNFDKLWNNYAHLLLNSFGENVGLPWGAIGSSEVGHTSLGSGCLVHQELSLIDKEIENKNFFSNEIILDVIKKTAKAKKSLHLVGLVSDGGVHSHMTHLFALLQLIKVKQFENPVYIHAITDGRDTSPNSSIQYLAELEKQIRKNKINAKVATICGRYFSMDRDNHWDRTKKAYLAMTKGEGVHTENYIETIQNSYSKKISDEFIEPIIVDFKKQNHNVLSALFSSKTDTLARQDGIIEENDGVIFFNIRPDRMRQISEMFLFKRDDVKTSPLKSNNVISLTTYNEYLPIKVAYPAHKVEEPLARILSDHNIAQGHFAETEKYAHVTYFFNGSNPEPYPKEVWEMVPSPNVKTYDLKPEMSAEKITDKVFETLKKHPLDFVLINYANADMVGHTGVYKKVVAGIETIDRQIGRLCELLPETTLMITADHGNAECMIHPETGEIDKKHSVNPIPFILVNEKFKRKCNPNESLQSSGILADVTPTILYFFDIKAPEFMNGINLINSLK